MKDKLKAFGRGLALACLFAIGAGCASFDVDAAKDRLGVQLVTMAYIEQGEDDAKRAARVLSFVEEARTLLDFADVSVADLNVALLARVAERDLTPLETLAARELISYLSAEIEARLTRRDITADQRVTVNAVLDLVALAAGSYVSH